MEVLRWTVVGENGYEGTFRTRKQARGHKKYRCKDKAIIAKFKRYDEKAKVFGDFFWGIETENKGWGLQIASTREIAREIKDLATAAGFKAAIYKYVQLDKRSDGCIIVP